VPHAQIHPEGDWADYYRATAGRMPSQWFVGATEIADLNHGAGRVAVDLGCGNGVETKALLDRGWTVHAFDRESEAIEFTRSRATPEESNRLHTTAVAFADTELPENDLVFAQLSIPFCPPTAFDHLWAEVTGSVMPNGFFVGQFLGPDDDWANGECLIHSMEHVRDLLDGWRLHQLDEVRHDGVAGAHREPKFWHIVSVVAQRT
jgi:predicted TPR repeat methyltransferase